MPPAQDVQGSLAPVEEIRKMDWDTLVGGRVTRTGTHADVDVWDQRYSMEQSLRIE
jgi:hypothetical protein